MNLNKLDFKPFVDETTNLIGYGTWNNPGKTDPEVDAIYLSTYYYYFAKLSGAINDFSGQPLNTGYTKALNRFKTIIEGVYRRFPRRGLNQDNSKPEALFTNPKNLSRDNTTPLIISLGEFGHYEEVKSAYKQLLKRKSFFQNTHTYDGKKKFLPDLATPDHHAMYIRSIAQAGEYGICSSIFLTSILTFLDIFGIFSMLLHVLHTHLLRADHTGSELNHIAICIQRERVLPTITGMIANATYCFRKNMPKYGDKSPIMNALLEFFTKGNRAHIMPPLDEVARIPVGIYLDSKALDIK